MARPSRTSPSAGGSQLPPPASPNVLYVIDLSGYVFRAYHAIAPLSSSKGEPTHAVMGTVNMLQKVVNDRRPELLAVAMDSKGPTFRKEIDARYKANRPPPPPDLSQQMSRCEELVRAYNIPIYQRDGIEADDLIASVVRRAVKEGTRVVIVSADKDLMQLVDDESDQVVLWDSMRDKVYGPPEVRAKFGVAPSQVRDFLALTGDSSDNIPGVPSVGPKTASDLLNEFGTLDGVYASLDAIKRVKLREALATHEEDARMSQRLVTLKEDAGVLWDHAHLTYGGANVAELRRLFTELEFSRMLDQIESAAPVTRSYAPVATRDALEKIAVRARERKLLGFHVITVGTEAMTAPILGIALSTAPGEGHYLALAHRYLGAPAPLDWGTVTEVLGPLFADPAIKKISHYLKFDEIVLARKGVTLAGPIFDSMIAAYLLDPESPSELKELARRTLGIEMQVFGSGGAKAKAKPMLFENLPVEEAAPFAAGEAELCVSLAAKVEPEIDREGLGSLMRDVELPLSRVLAQMEMAGVLVDASVLEALAKRVTIELRDLEAKAREIAKRDFSVRSRDQLETILFDELNLPVLKRTPKGGRSTDAEVLEELAAKHPLPKVICDYRELDKLKGTYIDALPRCINAETGRIHTRYDQTVAATGRLSSSDPNLQNIPIRTELGREIRAAFIAAPGHLLVSADYSQIELRVLAHLSKDAELIEAFASSSPEGDKGYDVHTHTAGLIFNVPKKEVTQEMRRRAKTINFGVIYGMGDSALARSLDITRAEAASFIEAYFKRYEGVARFMAQTVEAAGKGEAVRTILGRRRFLPNLHSANRGLRFEAERVAKNTPIQGTAADILKLAMVRLGSKDVVPGARMILTVHDELVFEVPEAHVAEAEKRIAAEMESAMKLDVPLVVDVGHGENWNLAH